MSDTPDDDLIMIEENLYQPGDAVEVRSPKADWWPGVVKWVSSTQICVELDAPQPNGSEWAGVQRRYGASAPVSVTLVSQSTERLRNDSLSNIRRRES